MRKLFFAALFAVALVAVSIVAVQDPMRPSGNPMAEHYKTNR